MNLKRPRPFTLNHYHEQEFDRSLLYNLKFFKYYIISYLYVFFTDAVWLVF